jgi:CRP-like cAMP-binding protein
MDKSEMINVLGECEFFRGLEPDCADKIAELCRSEEYGSGEYVFRQGDMGERIFIIAEGQVFLERLTDLGFRKGTATIGILGIGRVFGCWSTLLGESHHLMSSALCQKPTRVLAIKGSELRKMMIENREWGFNLMERLCFLLRDRIQGAYGAMEKI